MQLLILEIKLYNLSKFHLIEQTFLYPKNRGYTLKKLKFGMPSVYFSIKHEYFKELFFDL